MVVDTAHSLCIAAALDNHSRSRLPEQLKYDIGSSSPVYVRVSVSIKRDMDIFLASSGDLVKEERRIAVLRCHSTVMARILGHGYCMDTWDPRRRRSRNGVHSTSDAYAESGAECVVSVPIFDCEGTHIWQDGSSPHTPAGFLTLGWRGKSVDLSRCLPVMHASAAELGHGFCAAKHDLVQDVTCHFLPYLGATTVHANEPLVRKGIAGDACGGDDVERDGDSEPPNGSCRPSTPCGLSDSGDFSLPWLPEIKPCLPGTQDPHSIGREEAALLTVEELGLHTPELSMGTTEANTQLPSEVDVGGASAFASQAHLKGQGELSPSSRGGPTGLSAEPGSASKTGDPVDTGGHAPAAKYKARKPVEVQDEGRQGSVDMEQSAMWLTFKNPIVEAEYASNSSPEAGQGMMAMYLLGLTTIVAIWRNPAVWATPSAWFTSSILACWVIISIIFPAWYNKHREAGALCMGTLMTLGFGWTQITSVESALATQDFLMKVAYRRIWFEPCLQGTIRVLHKGVRFQQAALLHSPIIMIVSFAITQRLLAKSLGYTVTASVLTAGLPLLAAHLATLALLRHREHFARRNFVRRRQGLAES